MSSKQDALTEIVDIATRHGLQASEITAALNSTAQTDQSQQSIMMKLFAYLGGIMILSGICAFVGMFWDDMNSAGRIIITLGTGFTLYVLALIAKNDDRYTRIITPLLLISALLQPTGMFVAIDEFSTGGDARIAAMLVFGVMLVQQGCTFWNTKRAVLLFTTLCFGGAFFATTFDWLDMDEGLSALIIGFSLLCISYHISRSEYRDVSAFWYLVGSVCFLFGLFDLVEGTFFELVYLAASCFLIYVSTAIRSRTLLAVSTLSLLFYIGYFTAEHFIDSIGWPIALIMLGFIFFGISAAVVRIKNKYMVG